MTRIAALSDVHLGGSYGPGLDWALSAIDTAVSDGTDLIVFAGDLVDRSCGEQAVADAERLLRHAAASGIPVVGVWGNHDAAANLAERIPPIAGVTFAGTERPLELVIGGLTVHALSVATDPDPREVVEAFPTAQPGTGAHLGILHSGLDRSRSRSSCLPTTPIKLESRAYDHWILGHVHDRVTVTDRIDWVGMGHLLTLTT